MRAVLVLAASTLLMRHTADPLSAQFLPPEHVSTTHELGYSLSDRAYIAVFVILPGQGVAVLYPFNPMTKPEAPGDYFLGQPSNAGCRWTPS